MFKLSTISKASILASSALLLLAPIVAAENSSNNSGSVSIEVSSPLYDYTVKAGDSQQDIIKIKNPGKTTQTYYPEVLDFKSDNKSGAPIFLKPGETNGTYSLASWIKVSLEPLTIEPGQSEALNFYVSVPANAEPGGHYAGILFGNKPPETQGGSISVASKVGSLILVRVAGAAKESASIKSFTTDKPSYDDANNVNLTTTVTNSGSVHVQPKGVITIKNAFGGQIAAIDVNQLAGNVLPGSDRVFKSIWKDPGFKLGYYTATVVLSYGNPTQNMTASTSFWIIPWMTLLIALVVLILVILALYFGIKRYNAWIISKAQSKQ